MKQQTNANDPPGPWKEKQYKIHQNGRPGVQGMKTNAATIGLKDRIGQQVVQVHQHGGEQNQVRALPVFGIKRIGQ